ncbi:MAG TPA: response regulator [Planctomycetia bacterium]|nr:response regulator [Planctomycetia bacterium]
MTAPETLDNEVVDVTDLPYQGLRMLAVDDESTYIETYKRYFAKRGFEVDIANSLSEFEELLKARHHHIVLLDYFLDPDQVDGTTLIRMVEEFDRDASVIVVTGRPSLDTAVVSIRGRASDYISKPVKIDDLASAVDGALEKKGLLRTSATDLQRRIGDRIRERRKKSALTLTQLSQRTGLSVGFLSQIELGKNSASVDTLYRIARALGAQPGEFFVE